MLGAIALIVIAAINPIEQANRARDTRFKSDGAQLISAIDRYFAANSRFPWMVGTAITTEDSYGFVSASTIGVGLCSDASTPCGDGVLITSSELKSEFKNRDFVKRGNGTTADLKILIGKEDGSSSSVYACFIPLANSTKATAVANGDVYQPSLTTGGRGSSVTSCDGQNEDGQGIDWAETGCYVCVPQ